MGSKMSEHWWLDLEVSKVKHVQGINLLDFKPYNTINRSINNLIHMILKSTTISTENLLKKNHLTITSP